ncbi:MAG: glycosyltransferase family 2 protein [Pseudomonadota bacterium]
MPSQIPKATVLMPVYNGERFVGAAIDSILRQSFTDFELLIIDDASTDRTAEILSQINDSRIRIIRNEKNLKIVAALNLGLKEARGQYIVRMDADDISLAHRLQTQLRLMDDHPEVGACGSWIRGFGETWSYTHRYPQSHEEIVSSFLFYNPIAHPTVVMRRSVLQDHLLSYSPDYPYAEDWMFWQQIGKVAKLANLPKVLLKYRITAGGSSKKNTDLQRGTQERILRENLAHFNVRGTGQDHALHCQIGMQNFDPSAERLNEIEAWLTNLQAQNRERGWFSEETFSRVLGEQWFLCCFASSRYLSKTWSRYRASPFSRFVRLDLARRIKFAFKCALPIRTRR